MLFRTGEGKLIEIKKYDFKNDKLYYEKIIQIKSLNPKLEKTFDYKNYKQSNK
jgi:hypothetical protein